MDIYCSVCDLISKSLKVSDRVRKMSGSSCMKQSLLGILLPRRLKETAQNQYDSLSIMPFHPVFLNQRHKLPSKEHPSSPPSWCTGTQWAWQTKNCRSWWCHCWDLASPLCRPYRWAGSGGHALTQHTVWAPLLQSYLEAESGINKILPKKKKKKDSFHWFTRACMDKMQTHHRALLSAF